MKAKEQLNNVGDLTLSIDVTLIAFSPDHRTQQQGDLQGVLQNRRRYCLRNRANQATVKKIQIMQRRFHFPILLHRQNSVHKCQSTFFVGS